MEVFAALFVEHLEETAIAAAIAIGMAVLGRVLLFIVDKAVIPFTGKTKTGFDDALIAALKGPIFLVFLVVGTWIAADRLRFLEPEWLDVLGRALYIAAVLVGFYLLVSLVRGLSDWYAKEVAPETETTLDDELVPFFRRLVLGILLAASLILILNRLGYNVTALAAALGLGGFVICFAFQNIVTDILAGLVLWISRPVAPGDRIGSDVAEYVVVQDIGLRTTKVVTRDFREITIPNSKLIQSNIINFSRPSRAYRMETEVPIERGANIEKAEGAIIEAIADLADGKLYGPFEKTGLGERENGGPWAPEWVNIIKWYDTQKRYETIVFRGEYTDPRVGKEEMPVLVPCPGRAGGILREKLEANKRGGKEIDVDAIRKEFDQELEQLVKELGESRKSESLLNLYRETFRPQVYLTEIDGSRLILSVRCWISDCADYRQAQNQLNRAIYYALTDVGIKVGRAPSSLKVIQPEGEEWDLFLRGTDLGHSKTVS